MNYKLIDINKEDKRLIIDVDSVEIVIDYFFDGELGYIWEFNQYIFYNNLHDLRVKTTQKLIEKDIENFNYFIICTLEDYEG